MESRTGKSFEDTDYELFGIVDHNGNLTNAGALFADESPVRHSRVFCTRWNGLTKASGLMDALDDDEYSGGLVSLFQDGLNFIMRNSRKAWRKTPTSRIEYPDYPERAVTEGLVNALIHRNYMEVGSEVHIDIFDDRLEIYSPGGMVDGSTLEGKDLRSISSKRRNPVLADIFSRLQLMERRGSGFKKILEDYDFQEKTTKALMPKFVAASKDFLLTLYNLNYVEEQNVAQDVAQDQVKSKYEEEILALVKNNNKITREKIAQEIGVSKKTIEREIKKILKLSYIGRGYSGHWEVKE